MKHHRLTFAASLALFALPIAAFAAGPPEGRPTAAVPTNGNVTQIAPANSSGGVSYEKKRIKRTVPLDPTGGLDGKWDALYAVQDPSGTGVRTTYLDWDDDFVYVGIETPQPVQVRFDIDGRNDGWLRGADNLSLTLTPGREGSADPPTLVAQRFDMAQSRDQPVWAASPIPISEIKTRGGRTPRGTYAMTLAVPRTEVLGLNRQPGAEFGVRVNSGTPSLPANTGEVVSIPVRPMLRVELSEQIDASYGALNIRVNVNGQHDITPGGEVKTTLEITNSGSEPKRLSRLFLRGSLGDSDFVDELKFAGVDVEAGKTLKRDMSSTVAPAAPMGAIVLTGGADIDGGGTLAALTAFNKVEPYILRVDIIGGAVPGGGENGGDARRTARVILHSRSNARVTGKVSVKLPNGWRMESGEAVRDLAFSHDGEEEGTDYKFFIPATAILGAHTIEATAEVAGRTYHASGTVILVR